MVKCDGKGKTDRALWGLWALKQRIEVIQALGSEAESRGDPGTLDSSFGEPDPGAVHRAALDRRQVTRPRSLEGITQACQEVPQHCALPHWEPLGVTLMTSLELDRTCPSISFPHPVLVATLLLNPRRAEPVHFWA